MKNRLQIARELLSNEGFIFIQCDDFQNAYLKVLSDSIFGIENYRNSIYWHRTYAGKTVSKKLPWNTDTILLYSKNPETILIKTTTDLNLDDIKSYNKDDMDGRGKYNTVSLQKTGGPGPETTYDFVDNKGKVWNCPKKGGRMRQSKLKKLENEGRLYITETTLREKYYLSERSEIGKQIDNFWYDIGNLNRVNDLVFQFDGQKTEALISRILCLCTEENDIVLDFFLGSGTTAAVAHKMNRQYIGIEQMDYIESITFERIKKVIGTNENKSKITEINQNDFLLTAEKTPEHSHSFDTGGISKEVNWTGGGSFIYCELAQLNQTYANRIQTATTDSELITVWNDILKTGFISTQVTPNQIDTNATDFVELSLQDKQKLLMDLLDKNMLYINYCDIDDSENKVDQQSKDFTNSFYKVG